MNPADPVTRTVVAFTAHSPPSARLLPGRLVGERLRGALQLVRRARDLDPDRVGPAVLQLGGDRVSEAVLPVPDPGFLQILAELVRADGGQQLGAGVDLHLDPLVRLA